MGHMKIEYLLPCLVFAFAFSCSPKEKKATVRNAPIIPAEWQYLENEHYTIRYPQGWEVQKSMEGVQFCILSGLSSSVDIFRENVNLVIEDLLESMTLEQYAKYAVNNMKQKYTIADEKKYSVGGQVYYHFILKGKDGILLKQHYLVKGKRAYILTFAYDPAEKESIQTDGDKMMTSFSIK